MSCSELLSLKITKGKISYESIGSFPNSSGTGSLVWDCLCQKVYGSKPFDYYKQLEQLEKEWSMTNSLTLSDRAVFLMTGDKNYIRKANYKRASKDIRQFLKDSTANWEWVNHWPKIADLIEIAQCDAVGFHLTSVCENQFDYFDEELEDYAPISAEGFSEVYDRLDECVMGRWRQ